MRHLHLRRPPALLRYTILLIAFLAISRPGAAQNAAPPPLIRTVLTGYGTAGYGVQFDDDVENDFSASFTPVGLFQIGEDFLFESEFELSLHDEETLVTLEHASIHYLGFDRFQLKAGKFHVPFGIWMHAAWVNKMPTGPLLYADAHSGVAEEALLPVLFDVGVVGSGRFALSNTWSLGVQAMISQGPSTADAHAHGEEATGEEHTDDHADLVPTIAYGTNFEDNNSNKAVGLRLRLMQAFGLTVDLAGFHGAYDDEGELGVTAGNASFKWQPGWVDFRSEGVLVRQEFLHHNEQESVTYGGYYVQLSRRIGDWEPIVRWSHLAKSSVEASVVQQLRRRLSAGIIYWFAPSIPLKLAYQWELDGSDGFFAEWAVGF